MLVPDEVRKCVVYVGRHGKTGSRKLSGTAFIVARPVEGTNGEEHAVYCVTAKHVIDKIKAEGEWKVLLRVNFVGGKFSWIDTPLAQWIYHPDDWLADVAVFPFTLLDIYDHSAFPFMDMAADKAVIDREGIGIGCDVFLIGLFTQRSGDQRNLPIIRVGNIAAMPEEPVYSETWGSIDAYLVETRSLGGISGSPVFANMGTYVVDQENKKLKVSRQPRLFFLGLMHGHWNLPLKKDPEIEIVNDDADSQSDKQENSERINTGIAIVVPAQKILETFNQKDIHDHERKIRALYWENNSPTLDAT